MGLIDVLKNLLGKRPRPESAKPGTENEMKAEETSAQEKQEEETASSTSEEAVSVDETETSPEPQPDPTPSAVDEPEAVPVSASVSEPEPTATAEPEPVQEPVQQETSVSQDKTDDQMAEAIATTAEALEKTIVPDLETAPEKRSGSVASSPVRTDNNPICNGHEVTTTDPRTVKTKDLELTVNGIKLSVRPNTDKPAVERFSGEVITWNGGQYASDWIVYSKDFYRHTKINPSREGFRSTTLLNNYTLFLKRDGRMLSDRQIEVTGLLAKAAEEHLVGPAGASDFCLVSQGNSIQCFISAPKTSVTDENITAFARQAWTLRIKPRKKKK